MRVYLAVALLNYCFHCITSDQFLLGVRKNRNGGNLNANVAETGVRILNSKPILL